MGFLPAVYFSWHYQQALGDIWKISGNLFWFLFHFFSLPILVRTLFTPWRRLAESYHSRQSGGWLSIVAVNTLMRLAGLIIRLGLLIVGVLVLVAGLILVILVTLVWILLPWLVAGLISLGVYFLFS